MTDVVVPVAIDAGGGGGRAHCPAHAVDAALIDLGLLVVTTSAVHLGHRVAITWVVLMDGGMAALAVERCMHGLAEAISIHKERNGGSIRPVLDRILVAMAVEAALLGLLLGGRGTEWGGRQQKAREESEQDTASAA